MPKIKRITNQAQTNNKFDTENFSNESIVVSKKYNYHGPNHWY